MEKITKEELLEKLSGVQLSDDELEKISGGESKDECLDECILLPALSPIYESCVRRCLGS